MRMMFDLRTGSFVYNKTVIVSIYWIPELVNYDLQSGFDAACLEQLRIQIRR